MSAAGTRRVSEGRRAIPFLLPAILVMGAINLYPFINGIVRSLHSYRILSQEFMFTGLRNFQLLVRDELFLKAFANSVIWVGTCVSAQFVLAMILAMVLS